MGTGVGRPVPGEGRAALANPVGRRGPKGGRRNAKTPKRAALPREAPPAFEVRVFPTVDDVAEAAAEQFREASAEAIEARGSFHVALSGGSTPRSVHAKLAATPLRAAIDWPRVHFYFGDERCVPPSSERSNYRMAKETLFDPLGIAPERVARMAGEEDPKRAASRYAGELRERLPAEGGLPRFDFVYLGMGPDGHTASLFPGSRALREKSEIVAANWAQGLREWRITLTYPALNAARRVVFLAAGSEKAGPATDILERVRGYRVYPAALVRPRRGSLVWLLDEAAGGGL